MGILVTSSVCASIVLDHFGLVGFQEHAASWGRIAWTALMIAGVWLVATL
jgi:bacterial/archaeal transporter family-2 protein